MEREKGKEAMEGVLGVLYPIKLASDMRVWCLLGDGPLSSTAYFRLPDPSCLISEIVNEPTLRGSESMVRVRGNGVFARRFEE